MKEAIKYKEQRERQAYVPASMKVINVTAQRVLCQSGNQYNTDSAEMENQDVF